MKRKPTSAPPTFASLVSSIHSVDQELAAQAGRAVNVALTLRNWLIGGHIAEYELKGADRAKYGDRLLARLSARLAAQGVSRCEERELRRYRQFYATYPRIGESLTPEIRTSLSLPPDAKPVIRESPTPELVTTAAHLVTRLSFTHIAELVAIADPDARAFYETECIRGGWSVRELKRQIASLYWERSALSRDKKTLAARVRKGAEKAPARLDIKDLYVSKYQLHLPKPLQLRRRLNQALRETGP